MTLALTGERLTIADIKHFLNNKDTVVITEEALARVKQSRAIVEGIINNKKTIFCSKFQGMKFIKVVEDNNCYKRLALSMS